MKRSITKAGLHPHQSLYFSILFYPCSPFLFHVVSLRRKHLVWAFPALHKGPFHFPNFAQCHLLYPLINLLPHNFPCIFCIHSCYLSLCTRENKGILPIRDIIFTQTLYHLSTFSQFFWSSFHPFFSMDTDIYSIHFH